MTTINLEQIEGFATLIEREAKARKEMIKENTVVDLCQFLVDSDIDPNDYVSIEVEAGIPEGTINKINALKYVDFDDVKKLVGQLVNNGYDCYQFSETICLDWYN